MAGMAMPNIAAPAGHAPCPPDRPHEEFTVTASAAENERARTQAQDRVGNGEAAVAHPTSAGRFDQCVQNVERGDDEAVAQREFVHFGKLLDYLNQPGEKFIMRLNAGASAAGMIRHRLKTSKNFPGASPLDPRCKEVKI